ncbi:MAG: hypothetical protein FWG92_03540 [Leptospirales bacterium]|nr:hypothetical protein [Leptospirales bacterium]
MKTQIICLAICFLVTGCSYGMDWLEAALMERASFSIDVSYNSGNLTVSWSESPSDDKSFGGYEIYMILQPWNEFGTYEVIAARHSLYSSSSHFFRHDIFLGNSSQKSITIPVTMSDLTSKLGGKGEYYVRVGIIAMDKKDKETYYSATIPYDYNNYSSIDKISGYKAVYID